uniref:arginine deiminase-related protein n=1 Tax=uncultured Allobacillus sp. TaxID=1638025 RepID=UPI002596DCB4|nr:arginine deiminase-related protein [uncultured Allobacillus sp.]
MRGIALNHKINCSSEYSTLKKAVVVKPTFMEITEVINETQKHYKSSNIDTALALKQHKQCINILRSEGVEVIELSPKPRLNEQGFTRDTAFVIDDELFVASMSEEVRQDKTKQLKNSLHEQSISFQEGIAGSIEDNGYEVIPVDLSEIIKSGGSFRCCTLPLQRG